MPLPKRLACLVAAACAVAAQAQTTLTVYSSAHPGSLDPRAFASPAEGMVVPGYATVREERRLRLDPGRTRVRIDDVPALIDPGTVAFTAMDGARTRVIEQSFEYDLASSAKLLSKYIDREITVEQARGSTVETITGMLLGTQGGLTLRLPDGSLRLVEQRSGLRLPALPGGLVTKPALVWELEGSKGGMQRVRISYQTGGMTWWADYNLTLTEAGGSCRADLGAWATLVNQSGAGYADARLKLMAGDVQRAAHPGAPRPLAMASRAMAVKEEGFAEKPFFEYHLYTLARTLTLPNNSIRQVELFPSATGIACEKDLVFQGQAAMPYQPHPVTDRAFGTHGGGKVEVFLRVKNSAANGLGMPLPAGRVRVAKADPADGSLQSIGEDVIDHMPRDETVQVRLGSAFDVVAERRQLDFRVDAANRWMEEDIEVRVRNQKAQEPVKVIVREPLYRWSNWDIPRSSQPFTREDARTIRFPVEVAAKAQALVRYTVRYTW